MIGVVLSDGFIEILDAKSGQNLVTVSIPEASKGELDSGVFDVKALDDSP